jgi:4-hydroxythreonine-4-phosphate dehydrogenase
MSTKVRPILAITMGDAAGIGPEIIVKTLQRQEIYDMCRPLVIGEGTIFKQLKSNLKINSINEPEQVKGEFGTIDLLDLHILDNEKITTGKICAACGKAAMECTSKAAHLALEGKVQGLATAPLSKEATKLAGYADMGHLEFFAHLTRVKEYATMLTSGNLNVVHLTTHFSLRDACDKVTRESVLGKVKLTHDSFLKWGIKKPRIAVAALNPHAGEGGLLGREEIDEIMPAVKDAQKLGIDARGPYPADSVFVRAINGEFDVVIALYHDQGHIPVKVHGFEQSVSTALGLPFIRTSVDHGTAFDIAGKGIADATSMVEAIKAAVKLIESR